MIRPYTHYIESAKRPYLRFLATYSRFSKSAKARMSQQDWDENIRVWSMVIGQRVSEELEEVDPASADAVPGGPLAS